MANDLLISPGGRLVFPEEFDLDAKPDVGKPADALRKAFEDGSAAGLVALVRTSVAVELPPGMAYWRHFAQEFFHHLCHQRDGDPRQWRDMPPPNDSELSRLVAEAPPMPGLEYLTVDLLRRLWTDLRELATKQALDFDGGGEAYLQSVSPVLHLLGRVTLHLAENKQNPSHPFAFMATYTHRVSRDAKLRHLPLGKAIEQYAGEKNRTALISLLEPVRRAADVSPVVRELLDTKAIFQPQAWSITQAHRLLSEVPKLEECGLVVRLPDWWKKGKTRRAVVQVQVGKQAASQLSADSLLDFSMHLAVDGQQLTAKEQREILESTDGLFLLRGQWVEVDREKLQQTLEHWRKLEADHPDGISFLEGMRLIAGAGIGGDAVADEDATREWSMVTAGSWLKKTLQQIRDPQEISGCRPGTDLNATLRPYQAEGVRWLWFMNRLGIGGCLADDMGLGKTIQIIALLLLLKREATSKGKPTAKNNEMRKPTLLIVPASLVGNWKREIERFGPSLTAFYAHRSETSSDALSEVARNPAQRLGEFDVVVTTYGLARRFEWLTEVDWRLVALDEAQAIKNAGSRQTKAVKKFKSAGRFALTGTPVENQLGDLWSLFDFCNPGLLGTASQFKSYVNRLQKRQTQGAFTPLRKLVRPYILRRMKTDPNIVPDLPDKTEMRCECSLTKKQAVLYGKAVVDFQERLEHADGMARRGLVLATLMQLKQICNHPAQYLNEADYAAADSGKMARLAQLCEPITLRQEKMLVFTQFRVMTEPLAEFLATVFGREGFVLHGGTSVKNAKRWSPNFEQDQGPPFFVISLKAGGSGLNLTAASHVVHFDRWWNPAVENQATDRAFRIGQTKNVLVHKFVCRGTVEEKIDRMISEKQQLADELLDEGAEAKLTEMSDDELIGLVTLDLSRATAQRVSCRLVQGSGARKSRSASTGGTTQP